LSISKIIPSEVSSAFQHHVSTSHSFHPSHFSHSFARFQLFLFFLFFQWPSLQVHLTTVHHTVNPIPSIFFLIFHTLPHLCIAPHIQSWPQSHSQHTFTTFKPNFTQFFTSFKHLHFQSSFFLFQFLSFFPSRQFSQISPKFSKQAFQKIPIQASQQATASIKGGATWPIIPQASIGPIWGPFGPIPRQVSFFHTRGHSFRLSKISLGFQFQQVFPIGSFFPGQAFPIIHFNHFGISKPTFQASQVWFPIQLNLYYFQFKTGLKGGAKFISFGQPPKFKPPI